MWDVDLNALKSKKNALKKFNALMKKKWLKNTLRMIYFKNFII